MVLSAGAKGMISPPALLRVHGVMLAGEWRGRGAQEEGDQGMSGRMKGDGAWAVAQGQIQHRGGQRGEPPRATTECLRTTARLG